MKYTVNCSISYADLDKTACQIFLDYKLKFLEAFLWKESTFNSYNKQVQKLSPYLNIPIKYALDSDYENAINRMNNSRKKKYAPNSLGTIRSIINDICIFTEEYSHGKYQNVLWGTAWNKSKQTTKKNQSHEKTIQEKIDRKMRIPRSLTIPQEIKFLNLIKDEFPQNSLYLGAAIMFYTGLRPGECCGLKYGDIYQLTGFTEESRNVHCMRVYGQIRSTGEFSNDLKTKNAYRIIPVPTELYHMIEIRKQNIKNAAGLLDDKALDACPILCKNGSNENYQLPCNQREFTILCQAILRKCRVTKDTLDLISLEIKSENTYKEHNATSYLLRRNFATSMLGICGMEDLEIKYLMGHTIDAQYEKRANFTVPDELYKLWKKMNRRHYRETEKDTDTFTIDSNKALVIHQKNAKLIITKDMFQDNDKVKFVIWNDYPNDIINVKTSYEDRQKVSIEPLYIHIPLDRAKRIWTHREFTTAVQKSYQCSLKRKSKKYRIKHITHARFKVI